jgi:serine protease Do
MTPYIPGARGIGRVRQLLGLGALALGLPAALAAQDNSKTSAVPRVMAAMEATNALRSGGSPSLRPLPVGNRQSSSLDASDPTLDDGSHVEVWALELQAGQQVSVTMRSSEFDTMLLMMQVDNQSFTAENDDFEDGSTDSRISFRAPATGTYAILANSFEGGETGRYTIEATVAGAAQGGGMGAMGDLMGGGSGNALSYGQSVNGELTDADRTLDDGSKFDEYTFSGNAGDRIVITMRSSAFDTYLSLRSAAGGEVANNDDRADGDTDSEIVFTLPSTGSYTIWANAYESGSLGSYSLSLQRR